VYVPLRLDSRSAIPRDATQLVDKYSRRGAVLVAMTKSRAIPQLLLPMSALLALSLSTSSCARSSDFAVGDCVNVTETATSEEMVGMQCSNPHQYRIVEITDNLCQARVDRIVAVGNGSSAGLRSYCLSMEQASGASPPPTPEG
jgi:hypothetical protein